MSYPPNQPPPGPGWGGQDQGGWAPPPGPDQGWGPGPGQAPPGPPQQWAQPGYGTPPPGAPGGGVPYPPQKKSSPVLPIAIIVVLIAAAAGAFFVLNQGDDGGDPEAVATSYVEALIDRDCNAMADIVNMEGMAPADALAECQAAVGAGEGANEFLPTELISTSVVSEEEDTATVAAEVRLGSGDTTTQDVDMTRVDGDWRVNVDLGGPSNTIPPPDEPDSTTTTEDEPDSTTTTTESSTSDTTDAEGYTDEDHANRAACETGDMAACDDLYAFTPYDSEFEAFAMTCGGRAPEGGHRGSCEDTFG